jgi:CAAX prenyl protease-like protein
MILSGLCGLLDSARILPGGFAAMYLLYPVQTVTCALILAWFWRHYRLHLPHLAWLAIAIGILIFALWVSPQATFHQPPRMEGFDPRVFAGHPPLYWGTLVFRFARLVLVVPALEEVFWRGFLLRYLINEEFDAVPFGTYAVWANAIVALGFMLEHSTPDWPAALVTGFAYNFVAYRTRSLSSCILVHAVTNALLGLYIMHTRQWGFW